MITTVDEFLSALGNNADRIVINKASLANQTVARPCSMWRATGQAPQGASPGTTPILCTELLLGAIDYTVQSAPGVASYLGWLQVTSSVAGTAIEIHDRLAHSGGLVLNVTTPQTITGFDLSTIGVSNERRGEANFSDVQWYLEVYADGGATASNATINVTYNNGSTGNLLTLAVGGTIRAGNMFNLRQLVPPAQQDLFIRGINSVTLSASTTVAGNFGFTATRNRTVTVTHVANKPEIYTWDMLGFPEVHPDSCLFYVVIPQTTASGTIIGTGKIIHG